MGSWPQWMSRSVAALSDDWRRPTLPASFALTEAQRAAVERHLAALEEFAEAGPADRIGSALKALLTAFPAQHVGDDAMQARAGMFRIALDNMPAWAVERAVTFWIKRQHPEGGENYAFAPSPPQLGRLAQIAAGKVRGEMIRLRRLLAAEVDVGISEEQRARNLARLSAIVCGPAPDAAEDRKAE